MHDKTYTKDVHVYYKLSDWPCIRNSIVVLHHEP